MVYMISLYFQPKEQTFICLFDLPKIMTMPLKIEHLEHYEL